MQTLLPNTEDDINDKLQHILGAFLICCIKQSSIRQSTMQQLHKKCTCVHLLHTVVPTVVTIACSVSIYCTQLFQLS